MCGIEEPWTNNQGVAILPYIWKNNEYYFLLVKENNLLFTNKQISVYGTITGGLENKDHYTTVLHEMLEETGINVNTTTAKINYLGKHYANKISTKEWNLYGIDLTNMNLDLNATYKGGADGSIAEESLTAKFVNQTTLNMSNDALSLAIYGKLILNKKMESCLNVQKVNLMQSIEILDQSVTNSSNKSLLKI